MLSVALLSTTVLESAAALPKFREEGEALAILSHTGGKARPQITPIFGWSGGAQMWWTDAKPGDRLKMQFSTETSGVYSLAGQFSWAYNYGIHQLYLDGRKLGAPIDFYSREVVVKRQVLGAVRLSAGQHELEVEVIGANPSSLDYMFGLDFLEIEAVDVALARMLAEDAEALPKLCKEMDKLASQGASVDASDWLDLHERVLQARQGLATLRQIDIVGLRAKIDALNSVSPNLQNDLLNEVLACEVQRREVEDSVALGSASATGMAHRLADDVESIRRRIMPARTCDG